MNFLCIFLDEGYWRYVFDEDLLDDEDWGLLRLLIFMKLFVWNDRNGKMLIVILFFVV